MYGHVTTKIFRMYRLPNFFTHGARLGALGARQSSGIRIYIDSCQNRATTDKYHIAISKARVVVPGEYWVPISCQEPKILWSMSRSKSAAATSGFSKSHTSH